MTGNERDAARTRARILAIAQQLFAEHGYAGTSIADIASELGTSKAALYYHFASKEEILSALVAEPVAGYAELAARVEKEPVAPQEILDALIRMTAEAQLLDTLLGNDPSITSVLRRLYSIQDYTEKIVAGLAGPKPNQAAMVRARAAFAVAKQGTFLVIMTNGGVLTRAARVELLGAALRCLAG